MENFIEINLNNQMQRAIARAKQNRPRARVISFDNRIFQVDSVNHCGTYQITFKVENGKKFAACNNAETGDSCKGLNEKSVCYHVAVAAGINAGLRSAARNNQPKPLQAEPMFFLPNSSTKKPERIGNVRI